MRIGIQLDPRGDGDLGKILARFRQAEEQGFSTVWIGQVFELDILTLFALAGTVTSRIELATSVVPLPTRHPTVLAQQALTTQLATGGRLCLGVGCGHAVILDKKLGLESNFPVGRTREYLEVLRPLLRGEYVKHTGEYHRIKVSTPIEGAQAPSVILAALGPRMIDLAGELCDGVTLVFAGAGFVAERVRPWLPEGSRIVASLPVIVTDDAKAARANMAGYIAPSLALPAYQRTLHVQGIESPLEVSPIGTEAEVHEQLDALADAGVTDLNPIVLPIEGDPSSLERTTELLTERARKISEKST